MADDGRRMIYPITLAQKVKHFPYAFHWKHLKHTKCFVLAIFLTLPLAYKIQKLSFHESNVRKYEDYVLKEEKARKAHEESLEKYYGSKH